MSGSKPAEDTSGLMGEILAAAGVSDAETNANKADQYFLELSRLDYASRLSRKFDRGQIRGLMGELTRRLPALNHRVFSETNLGRLGTSASELGAELQPRAFEGSEGTTLRGFYVNDVSVISRPLIVVNTANDPVCVAATFWHEVGHHLTQEIFGRKSGRMRLNF
ncbi:MAG TPA: hypothetical protein VMT64_03450, partial [Candidatus Binataceae bacterium]|nr:hypothetical protein [Candidatus Binataceae bacterium]